MSVILGVGAGLGVAALWLLRFIITTEYGHWGRRLGRWMVRTAAKGAPKGQQDDYREEWEAELAAAWTETDKKCTGLVFAGCLFGRYAIAGLWRSLGSRWSRWRLRPPSRTGEVVINSQGNVRLLSMPGRRWWRRNIPWQDRLRLFPETIDDTSHWGPGWTVRVDDDPWTPIDDDAPAD